MILVSDMNVSLTQTHTIQILTYEYIDTPSQTKVIKRERKTSLASHRQCSNALEGTGRKQFVR